MSILIFLAVLFVLVLVHEWGHFIVAKKTGMRVDEFGIGFPPKLFGVKKGETEYTFNALPIGGFVKIFGENSEELFAPVESEAGEGGTKVVNLEVSAEAEARKAVVDTSRAFGSRPKWAQALVLIAGVTMNIIFAWFLFSLTFILGVPTAVDEESASDQAKLYITDVIPGSPASAVPAGSVVTAIEYGDVKILNPNATEFKGTIAKAAPNAVSISYEYSGEKVMVDINPQQGLVESDPEKYLVGTSLAMVEVIKQPFFTAIYDGLIATWDGLVAITTGLFGLLKQTVVGQADFSQVAGPVGIVGMVGDAASFGLTTLLTFTAIISLNLAVINLLPFPALDGGRLVFVAIEAVTRKRIPAIWTGRVNLVGFALLMILMITVTYSDIVKLL